MDDKGSVLLGPLSFLGFIRFLRNLQIGWILPVPWPYLYPSVRSVALQPFRRLAENCYPHHTAQTHHTAETSFRNLTYTPHTAGNPPYLWLPNDHALNI